MRMIYLKHHRMARQFASDGDVVFQLRKTPSAGLWEAVNGRVLTCLHKEQMLKEVERRYPARPCVIADDKLRILAAMKKIWSETGLMKIFKKKASIRIGCLCFLLCFVEV